MLAIISDIHDNIINLKKCLKWCQENKIKKIACCGDVTNKETLKFINNQEWAEIFLIKGNMDIFEDHDLIDLKNIKYLGRTGFFIFHNKKIGLCHESYYIENLLKEKPDIIFYGHTHKPWQDRKEKTEIINPGTLGGVFTKATFAIYNEEKNDFELKILEIL